MARITLRLPADLYERLKDMAKRNRRSMNAQILYLLDQAAPVKRRSDTPEEKAAREERSRKQLETLPKYETQ